MRALQKTAGVGAIFTRSASAGSLSGWAEGTLSFDAARWTHARSGDILYSPDWTDNKNAHGVPGTSASNGVAGHGSSTADSHLGFVDVTTTWSEAELIPFRRVIEAGLGRPLGDARIRLDA